ncbi:hypothetical protein EVAR_63690_1 [Eumeta japonica]|uniref:Transposable element P transposase-like RNase H domain-containing protein n=1 Tax=Eumeta variegata TaxID=151549 RepID=A0A4C1ZAG8_EUMVA|nr:hypothetical protein EVAR_63690_1 [Eumeta japonica]
MSSAAQEALWLQQLHAEVGQQQKNPLVIFSDNESAIKLSNNNCYLPRSRHIDIRTFNTCLPHPRTIKKWYQTLNGKPGFTRESLVALKLKHSLAEAKEALVFLVTAINGNWKIPVGYFLVEGITGIQRAELVKQCLKLIHETATTAYAQLKQVNKRRAGRQRAGNVSAGQRVARATQPPARRLRPVASSPRDLCYIEILDIVNLQTH